MRTVVIVCAALACVATSGEGGSASGAPAKEKDEWRRHAEGAVGRSKACRASLQSSFESCFARNWGGKQLRVEFADCVNNAAGATCVAAGKHADGSFTLEASPLAPP